MLQLGWRRASDGAAVAIRSADHSRNGPPEAVRMSRDTAARSSPTRHCQMAECSESMGRSQASGEASGDTGSSAATAAARARARGMTR